MKKRIVTIALVVALLATCFAGTWAYLQDDDAAHNVMTVGNVYIEQTEWQRDGDGGFKAFEQNKLLMPGVYTPDSISACWKVPYNTDELKIADGAAWNGFWGVEADGYELDLSMSYLQKTETYNALDKIVVVKNTGTQPCYYRTLIAIEKTSAKMHMNKNGNSLFKWANGDTPSHVITIGDTNYELYVATYQAELKADEVSRPSLLQVMLDKGTTNAQINEFGKQVDILCMSQAVQVQGFATPELALDTAFGAITAEKAIEWLTPVAKAPAGSVDSNPAPVPNPLA